MDYGQTPWMEIAWNGIRFTAPADWQVGTIGKHYLMLEEESRPVLEFKWGQVKGAFSHQAHLSRLAALHKKKLGKAVSECPLPAEWEEALGKYKATGFSWQGKTICGKGVILYCPACQNATLIQFYQRDSSKTKEVSQRLLRSFQDHREDNQIVWSVFGIRATIPDTLHLVRHRFEAGRFEMAFKSKEHKVTLHRWGPASFLLSNQDLSELAGTMLHHPWGEPYPVITVSSKAVEWSLAPPPTIWAYWWNRIKAKPSFQWFRLWHLEERNCIFGVEIEGKRPLDPRFLDRICTGYECV